MIWGNPKPTLAPTWSQIISPLLPSSLRSSHWGRGRDRVRIRDRVRDRVRVRDRDRVRARVRDRARG